MLINYKRLFSLLLLVLISGSNNNLFAQAGKLIAGFKNPPQSAKPGVYWYFMDGNMTKASITSDLESMKKAGIGHVIFLEVNVGIPRGPVDFLSEQWQNMFTHAVRESERLGISITLGIGPGWTGSGGPWVKPEQSMQHLVFSETKVADGSKEKIILPIPKPMAPFFGEGGFTPELKDKWNAFYEDVAVLAYPTPAGNEKISDIHEKALYYRAPYSSAEGVKQYLPSSVDYKSLPQEAVISKKNIIDLTGKLQSDGILNWTPPTGNWTIMRFGRRNNGAVTRPAPMPGLGFEADKLDTVAMFAHLDNYIGKLLRKTGKPNNSQTGGLKALHMDSWEMGAQNWTPKFRAEFTKRRGYDPLPYYPVYAGSIVGSVEISERFLWDLRQTAQELVLEQHAQYVKKYAHRNNMLLSIEPYDMNPTSDMELGSVADVVMAEFWSKGLGFNSSFSVIEAASIAHVKGQALLPAESFTSQNDEGWKQYPGAMKNQGDWAFAAGINRFVYHTFQNQFLADSLRPGATMGPYGVHWDRNQTWWPMVSGYHNYVSRSQYLLQQGRTVADVLYLTPEGSPHVFRPPFSAIVGDTIPDRKGYNFDGCAPGQLYKASVNDGRVVFPGGASYRILVLPALKTMTPTLLNKIRELVYNGATVVGAPPQKSPGLSGYPACDEKLFATAKQIWGDTIAKQEQTTRVYGKGKVIWGGELDKQIDHLYPEYDLTAKLLSAMNIPQDFESDGPVRYTHRTGAGWDMYFVSNTSPNKIKVNATFRSSGKPQLWDANTGEIRALPEFAAKGERTTIPLQFDAYQSYFIVYSKGAPLQAKGKKNFADETIVKTLTGPWDVSFDEKWGGPKHVVFNELTDWTKRPEDGIKYYSGIAVYRKQFDLPGITPNSGKKILLDLGGVSIMAKVKLNGKYLGVVWTAPNTIDISSALKSKGNVLEIEVANLWPNRLIGDERLPSDGIQNYTWPEWLVKGQPRPGKRFTFATYRFYSKDSPLYQSGLIGPVSIKQLVY